MILYNHSTIVDRTLPKPAVEAQTDVYDMSQSLSGQLELNHFSGESETSLINRTGSASSRGSQSQESTSNASRSSSQSEIRRRSRRSRNALTKRNSTQDKPRNKPG